jgi:hypothetical protein
MPDPELELKRWTRVEYEKLIDQGVFTPEDRIEPIRSATMPYGWDYRLVQIVRPGESVTALSAPHASIVVADLLPPP